MKVERTMTKTGRYAPKTIVDRVPCGVSIFSNGDKEVLLTADSGEEFSVRFTADEIRMLTN